MKRKIDDKTYLNYLLQSLNVNELKQICRDFEIKGFSKLTKAKLIEFILDSLAEEEIKDLLKEKELEIISKEMELAIKKINGEDRETIDAIKVVNPDMHEIEITFKGFNWETTSLLSITDGNIENPVRDCDCRIGSNMGFCNHFWVGFIILLKKGFFNLKNWNLTLIPKDFENKIKNIVLSGKPDAIKLINKASEDFEFLDSINKSITVYEGEIMTMEKKEQDFQGNITIYYIVALKNVKFGPRIQKKSDFKEEDIKTVEHLNLRISQKLHDDNDLQQGDILSANGKLTKDNFLSMFIVKNIRKIKKI